MHMNVNVSPSQRKKNVKNYFFYRLKLNTNKERLTNYKLKNIFIKLWTICRV